MTVFEGKVRKVLVSVAVVANLGLLASCGTASSPSEDKKDTAGCEETTTPLSPEEKKIDGALDLLCGRLDTSCDRPSGIQELQDCLDS